MMFEVLHRHSKIFTSVTRMVVFVAPSVVRPKLVYTVLGRVLTVLCLVDTLRGEVADEDLLPVGVPLVLLRPNEAGVREVALGTLVIGLGLDKLERVFVFLQRVHHARHCDPCTEKK